MAIRDTLVTDRPPAYHAHQYDASTDNVLDLNNWATVLHSPAFSPNNPAFSVDTDGKLWANVNGQFTMPVLDGWWIVFSAAGNIEAMTPDSFENKYEPVR